MHDQSKRRTWGWAGGAVRVRDVYCSPVCKSQVSRAVRIPVYSGSPVHVYVVYMRTNIRAYVPLRTGKCRVSEPIFREPVL